MTPIFGLSRETFLEESEELKKKNVVFGFKILFVLSFVAVEKRNW